MKYLIPAITVFALLPSLFFAQAPDTLWTRTYGGMDYDGGFSVQQTSDGGYIIAGYTYSFGSGQDDIYCIKTDANGDSLWSKTYGGSSWELGFSVQQTFDDGYVIVGETSSFGTGGDDVYLIKIDVNGDTLWTKTYGSVLSDRGYSVQQITDSGYIIVGVTGNWGPNSDVYLIRTDSFGDTLWTRTYGGDTTDVGNSVQQTSDGGYIIAGYTYSFGSGEADVYLIKTNASGDIIWAKTYGGTDLDVSWSVQECSAGGYVAAGWTHSFGVGNGDIYLIKTDPSGDTLWTSTYGGTDDDFCRSVQQTSDGGYIVAGSTNSFGAGNYDVFIVKTNADGDILWTQTYGTTYGEMCYSIKETTDRGYIMTGNHGTGGMDDVWLLKTEPDTLGVDEQKVTSVRNGAVGATIISGHLLLPQGKKCKVFDITGRVVEPAKIQPGIYFVEIDGLATQKVVKVR